MSYPVVTIPETRIGTCGETVIDQPHDDGRALAAGERHQCMDRAGHSGKHRCSHGRAWVDAKSEP